VSQALLFNTPPVSKYRVQKQLELKQPTGNQKRRYSQIKKNQGLINAKQKALCFIFCPGISAVAFFTLNLKLLPGNFSYILIFLSSDMNDFPAKCAFKHFPRQCIGSGGHLSVTWM
jgi:hypothetical protein